MRIFSCSHCGQLVYFENSRCERCGHSLGFDPATLSVTTLTGPDPDGPLVMTGGESGQAWKRCANAVQAACNWLVPEGPDSLCLACALERRIPDLSMPENQQPFRDAETARRRLIYALLRFGLPLSRPGSIDLTFDLLSDAAEPTPVLTGHADGLITINLAEADPAERERRRHDLGEAYRTLLGHFRHEVGHFYWDALVADAGEAELERCRAVFGDDRADYDQALKRHYAEGAPLDWRASFVSAYATMHPWEDFAETWAHYMHIVDALDTAEAFGVRVDPGIAEDPALATRVRGDAYRAQDVETLVRSWLPLSYALNSLNRSLGQSDLYPFVLSDAAIAKLGYVHDLIRNRRPGQVQETNRAEAPALT